jgi:CDP-6-deoxy-D-xylo-4-hexulose-3-dehydrase
MSGAIGSVQIQKFPKFLSQRKKNAEMFLDKMKKYNDIITQKEIGTSSWFGFSMVIKPDSKRTRSDLVKTLYEIGFECRPIVAGNFAKNDVVKYFSYEVHDDLKNANLVDKNGIFIGNHHINMEKTFKSLVL